MTKKIIVIFLFIQSRCFSQSPPLSLPEFYWALSHPIAAIKVKVITKRCDAYLQKCYSIASLPNSGKDKDNLALDNYNNGGKQDAFRHVFFMAAYSSKIKPKKLRKLGRAHEKANYRSFLRSRKEDGEMPDSLGSVMDLQNNELGIKIGRSNKTPDLFQLLELVISEINNGKAVIMKRDQAGRYLDCQGKIIDPGLFKKKWYVPKCLVASDYQY